MPILRVCRQIWPSLLAAVLTVPGAFLSLGLLGLALYHLVAPVLNLRFPPLAAWDQSLVWPLIVAMPMVWAPSFILAGLASRHLRMRGAADRWQMLFYVLILWLAALAVWWLLLLFNPTLWR